MKLLFVSAVMATIAVTVPGATAASDNYGVDSNDSELSSSYDMYPEDSASSEDWMDSEDEIAEKKNNNMFVTIDSEYYPDFDCDVGPSICENYTPCVWECKTRFESDRYKGCCVNKYVGRPNPSPPTRRPTRPTRRPTPRPTPRRPSRPSNSGGTSFDSGLRQGRREAEDIWYDLGSSCASAWSEFRDSVSRRKRNNGWLSEGNWRTRAYNQGARAGMNEVVTEKEKECFHDSAEECVDLGNEAARILAYNYCESMGIANVREWRRQCLEAAVDQCRGQMFSQVKGECGSPNTSDLRNLQSKCRNQVETMIGDRSEE